MNLEWDGKFLPPWGIVPSVFRDEVDAGLIPPERWRAPDPTMSRQKQWVTFVNSMVKTISDHLWPEFIGPAGGQRAQWSGAAADQMVNLTEADLDLLETLRVPLEQQAIRDLPIVHAPFLQSPLCLSHFGFFVLEDGRRDSTDKSHGPMDDYGLFDTSVKPEVWKRFTNIFWKGIEQKDGTANFQFKERFQRPRPYQMARLFGRPSFSHEYAQTSVSSSLQSGHALHALMGVSRVMETILEEKIPFNTNNWEILKQFAVDFGDRRVMAGVHYCTDNLASWIVFMSMADSVLELPHLQTVKGHIADAITRKSLVYRMLNQAASSGGKYEVFRRGLHLLRSLLPASA